MTTHVTFAVGPVSSMSGGIGSPSGQGPNPSGEGFNILNQHGLPLISFLYPTAAEAQAARLQIEAALADAIAVMTTLGP
jgi:hypothetical protein